ncbi:hypothetical protein N7539_001878 [Penicillium diatomitis]|uniref:Uncharacterized protein n=1 Tax=Penicillium diatomitis TaxID=2819901 RepID=A0A9X0C031_9EURO|nr:uncharacterized protein N7539_001878 [Penicillium diatomitis]KAJ5493132.1 hypothetical protein N7539_001878 [Penicillium diatomitis]
MSDNNTSTTTAAPAASSSVSLPAAPASPASPSAAAPATTLLAAAPEDNGEQATDALAVKDASQMEFPVAPSMDTWGQLDFSVPEVRATRKKKKSELIGWPTRREQLLAIVSRTEFEEIQRHYVIRSPIELLYRNPWPTFARRFPAAPSPPNASPLPPPHILYRMPNL